MAIAMINQDDMVEELREFADRGDAAALTQFARQYSPDIIAELLDKIDDADIVLQVLAVMNIENGAETLMALYPELRVKLIEDLPTKQIAEYIRILPSDDAEDILDELEEDERVGEVLAMLPAEERLKLEELYAHPDESAGAIMAHEVEHLPGSYNVAQAIADLLRFGENIEEIFQIFITDESGKLLGSLPIQRLLVSSPAAVLETIADEIEVVVPVNTDREQVADMFRRKDIISAPVVDMEGRLLGRITVDDVIDVMDEEASEDIYKMVGIGVEEDETVHDVRRRIPWLLIAFGGELLSGLVLKYFSATLRQAILLASFIPLIMALGGNVGMQSAAVMIRRIALARWGHSHHKGAIGKEIIAGVILGILTGILLFIVGIAWGEFYVGAIAGIAIFIAMTVSACVGSILPVVLSKLGTDPAFATGPFITTFNDVIGLFIYLLIATMMLSVL